MSRQEAKQQKGSGDEVDPAPNGASGLFASGRAARSLAASSRLDDSEVHYTESFRW
jgi:hypothetical protein